MNHEAVLDPDLADRRLSDLSRALIEKAILIEQTLGIGVGVVRIGMDDLIAIVRQFGPDGDRGERKTESQTAGIER